MFKKLGYLICVTMLSTAAYATDYDYESARRAWESTRSDLERAVTSFDRAQVSYQHAQNQFDTVSANLQQARSDLSSYLESQADFEASIRSWEQNIRSLEDQRRDSQRDQNTANRNLREAEQALDAYDRRIVEARNTVTAYERHVRDLEGRPRSGQWTCSYVDRGWEEHSRGHTGTADTRDEAAAIAEADCLSAHGSCVLSSCSQPDDAELLQARRDLQQARTNVDDLVRYRYQYEEQVTSARRYLNDLQTWLQNSERELAQARQSLESERRQLNDLAYYISDARRRMQIHESELSTAQSTLYNEQRNYALAEQDYQRAAQREAAALAYYQQVTDNYNSALSAAADLGRSEAARHAAREANERAPIPGSEDGRAAGTQKGRDAGLGEARAISDAQGYNHGLSNGRGDSTLASYYNQGKAQGQEHAKRKAQAENLPRSYNNELNRVLGLVPTKVARYDISDELPSIPGEVGPALNPQLKAIGNIAEPQFSSRAEPAARVPAVGTVSVNPPATDFRYYSERCPTLALPVFTDTCKNAYANGYESSYKDTYRQAYGSSYRTAFEAVVSQAYQDARSTRQHDAYTAAARIGAEHRGILDGFSAALSDEQSRATNDGIVGVSTFRSQGFLPVLRSVSLTQAVEDRILSPGEAVKVSIVIDNYGLRNAKSESLQIKLETADNLKFSVLVKNLPAIEADTRVHLTGVLKGNAGLNASSMARIKAVLQEVTSNGGIKQWDEAEFQEGIRSPIEFVEAALPDPMTMDRDSLTRITLKNLSSEPIPAQDMPFRISGQGLKTTAASVQFESIAPGASVSVMVPVVADFYASTTVPVVYHLSTAGIAGSADHTISKTVKVNVARNAELKVCIPNCDTSVSLPLRVRAGSILNIPTRFKFTGTTPVSMSFGKQDQSDPTIGGVNNGTVSVGPNTYRPGSGEHAATFSYSFPTALRGQTHWVRLFVREGNTFTQFVYLPVIVE